MLNSVKPPWTQLGKELESRMRKAIFEHGLLEGVDKLAVALSGGKDSLAMLCLLSAVSGRGLPAFEIHAIHVTGEFSCGAGVNEAFLRNVCAELGVNFVTRESAQKRETLECYSCSRERRKLIFNAAKELGATTIAFGHHRDDSAQTLMMNLLQKGEFAAILPKVPMIDYGVTLIRPLIYITENELREFAKLHGFSRITCQCPVGQNSMRKRVDTLISDMEQLFPHARSNLALAAREHGSQKALRP